MNTYRRCKILAIPTIFGFCFGIITVATWGAMFGIELGGFFNDPLRGAIAWANSSLGFGFGIMFGFLGFTVGLSDEEFSQ